MAVEIETLIDDLIQTCRNGEAGYRLAAERVKDRHLADVFQRYSQQRAQFAAELAVELVRLGGSPTAAGAAATDWQAFAHLLDGSRPTALMEEIRRREGETLGRYERALEALRPSELRSLVMRQYEQVHAARSQVRLALT